MSDPRQPPRVVASYSAGIQARNAARQEERKNAPVFPNLAEAAVTHDPGAGRTLEQVGAQQRADAETPPPFSPQERAPLSAETVEGLRALHAQQAEAAAKRQQLEVKEAETPLPAPAPEADVEDELDSEDAEFASAMTRMRKDVLQNERERRAVAERSGPIDMSDVLTGEFTQLVPVVPTTLEVRYKCLTTAENNHLRLKVIDEIEKEPKKAHLAKDILGFYQTVATVVSINKTVFPRHTEVNASTLRTEFYEPIFDQKVEVFQQYPLPVIAALGTHSSWFEQRVRELFVTTDPLKNG